MSISFTLLTQQGNRALYSSIGGVISSTTQSTLFYFVFLSENVTAPQSINTLQQCFDTTSPVFRGAFVFVEGTAPSAEELCKNLNEQLSYSLNPATHTRLAWYQDGTKFQIQVSEAGSVPSISLLPFGRWIIEVGEASVIAQQGIDDQILIRSGAGNTLTVNIKDAHENLQPTQSSLTAIRVPLSGAHTGGMLFDWDWQHYELKQQFGGEIRMFYGSANTMIRYPLFTPPSPPDNRHLRDLDLAFNVTAHPLAPQDGSRTRLAFNPLRSTQNQLEARFMRTPTGSAVTLKPVATDDPANSAGFGFAKTATADGKGDLYMTPVGSFSVQKVPDQPRARTKRRIQKEMAVENTAGVHIMAGLSGSEFLFMEEGDLLVFENNQPAFVKGFDPNSTGPSNLTDEYTTSWVRVQKKNGADAAADNGLGTSYCAQPSRSTYFARPTGGSPGDFPVAAGVSLSQLGNLAPEENPLFPLLPYGGVFYKDNNPNPTIDAAAVESFEKEVIQPHRRTCLEDTFNKTLGPIFFDARKNQAFPGGYARTPLGFVAELNTDGSWATLQLAQSPEKNDQSLQVPAHSNGVVNPKFSNHLMDDNVFMVVAAPDILWPAKASGNEIQLGDFTFQVDISRGALVVFKFIPGVTFVDLIGDETRWTSTFGDGGAAQKQITDSISQAKNGGSLYDAFNSIVTDPEWTGILVFNCPLDYQQLPSDIQILLGGIQGSLKAHHFGVTVNRVEDSNGAMSIQNSSLFAVIDYNQDLKQPSSFPNFQVLKFNVEYANSKEVTFNSQIAFSLNELFGTAMSLTTTKGKNDKTETGTIVIDGVYTRHDDGTGTLAFVTDDTRVFTANAGKVRVLQAQSVDNATLAPVTSTPQDDGSTIAVASFRLDGTLVFNEIIKDLDFFSYGDMTDGNPDKGLVMIDYAFTMTTKITGNAAELQSITPDLASLKVDQAKSESRDGSFNKSFPSKIDSLRYVKDGLSIAQPGAWQVQDDNLENLAPQYMLDFKIPLGSLGGLVSSTSNIVADFCMGWIPGGEGANDRIGAVLLLPALVSGADGFNIQGIVSAKFESIHLEKTSDNKLYYLRFEHFSASLLGIPLIYQTLSADIGPRDLGIFGDPSNPGGDNVMWVVGKSVEETWPGGPTIDLNLFKDQLPKVFIGRSYAIDTDPTDPKVIDDAIGKLDIFGSKTVADCIDAMEAQYDSAAGMTFALAFALQALEFSLLLHDNDFYGAKIKLDFSEEEENGDGNKEGQENGGEKKGDDGGGGEKPGLDNLNGLEFLILYRKISEHLGVWATDVFIDVGEIQLGAATLTLPDFSISIWTNGDWRFSVGWPLDDHPITVQFQAGPIPVLGKIGFYLAKLRSEDAPSTFLIGGDPITYPPNFMLIWSFGLGISAGVGKEWEQGPFSASASLTVALTVQGFLASFKGDMSKDGVDYHWWCISLALVGEVEGKVDFKIISASLAITLTLKLALALETLHSTHLVLTFDAEVEASIKIIFITISFSFQTELTILDTTFGSGPEAGLDGPNPAEVADHLLFQPLKPPSQQESVAVELPTLMTKQFFDIETVAVETPVTVELHFVLLSTAISSDGTTWTPQGVASLVVENGDIGSPFGQLALGLANWLLENFAGGATDFNAQLKKIESHLQNGDFDDQVEKCLSSKFVFEISSLPSDSKNVAVMPVHPSLGLSYNGNTIPFGTPPVSDNYADQVKSYFEQVDPGVQNLGMATTGNQSVASLLFDDYFVMFAKQLIAELQRAVKEDPNATNLEAALNSANVLSHVSGYVSRFLMGGIRLPKPDDLTELAPLYVLTHQQFELDTTVLDAQLNAPDPGALPDWIKLNGDVTHSLDPKQVYEVAPDPHRFSISQTPPLSPHPLRFPMNVSLEWTDTNQLIFSFADSLHLAIEKWQDANKVQTGPWLNLEQVTGSTPKATQSKPYQAASALVLPLSIKPIPKPGGNAGEVLPDIYSLVGTDEVHRAYLQALLDDPNKKITSLSLLANASQGKYNSTQPKILVRANLSTSTAAANPAAATENALDEPKPVDLGPNYAYSTLADAENFLRLVWECSIVHTGGFYLQIEGLQQEQFENGQASLQLVVQCGAVSDNFEAKPYHNALIGTKPDENSAVIANLNADKAKPPTPVVNYKGSYPGGNVGWSITWNDPPINHNATDDDHAKVLRGLYQMVSYRVTAIGGVTKDTNWSRPVTGLHDDGTWNYQKSFPTAPLLGKGENTYAAVGKEVDISISIEDIFGNSLPPASQMPQKLTVFYNDDILDLAHWAGTQTNFQIAQSPIDQSKVQLTINLSYNALPNPESDKLKRILKEYGTISSQLQDPNLSAAVSTGSLLGPDMKQIADGSPLVNCLQDYVNRIIAFLKAGTGNNPAVSLQFELDKSYPLGWDGDLRELRVSLVLARTGVDADVAAKAPQVAQVSSPITPLQKTSKTDDPTGLSAFAVDFEQAYYQFDAADGVIKVATGANSDLKSSRLGMQSLWLARCGAKSGITVQILNDEKNEPVYYAPPPLSTQLITRQVDHLWNYSTDTSESQVFSSIDIDRWAASFLSSLENIFSPEISPSVASTDASTNGSNYNSYVTNKANLAQYIANQLALIYQGKGNSDPDSAKETMRQALLTTLENDYGISTLVQMAALIGLHGDIGPGGSASPNIYGNILPPSAKSDKPLPYNFTPAKLPLKPGKALPLKPGKAWLNFLLSVQDPAAQKALQLMLDYQMGFIEHQIDPKETVFGYTPSNWLTFVLQQNAASLPQGPQNTLTAPMGTPRIPIPLRAYPPLPKLLGASATQDIDPQKKIQTMEDALCWTYKLTVSSPAAAQDTLNLMVTFNEPPEDKKAESATLIASGPGRRTGDLFDALARFTYEYPNLEPGLKTNSNGEIKNFLDLVSDVANAWPAWKQPEPPAEQPDDDSAPEVWTYVIDNRDNNQLSCTRARNRTTGLPPWPSIDGYTAPKEDGKATGKYSLTGSPQDKLNLSWEKLYVLDYQSARASAFIERNSNLGDDVGKQTNPAFVYQTETVKMPTPVVPLIKVQQLLSWDSGFREMFDAMRTIPAGAIASTDTKTDTKRELKLEGLISYSFCLLDNGNHLVFLPLFLMQKDIQAGEDSTNAASQVASQLNSWQEQTNPSGNQGSVSFRPTIFATKIVQGDEQLPLVQFQEINLKNWPTIDP